MNTARAKQMRADARERDLVAIAESVIADHGSHGLNIDKLAARFELSRPTIYQHFRNKADVLCAVASRVLDRQARACDALEVHAQTAREKMLILAMAYGSMVHHYPSLIALNLVLHDRHLMSDASEPRRERLRELRTQAHERAAGYVDEAIDAGDLPAGSDPTRVLLPIWSMMVGGSAFVADPQGDWHQRIEQPDLVFFRGLHALFDGLGWGPSIDAADLDAYTQTICQHVSAAISGD